MLYRSLAAERIKAALVNSSLGALSKCHHVCRTPSPF